MRHVLLGVILALLTFGAQASQRLALVIGIDRYENVERLKKAGNDARSVALTLDSLGFKVSAAIDADRRTFNKAVADIAAIIAPGDEVVFYFAGHGIEVSGRNYLLPADVPPARPGDEDFVTGESIAVDRILTAFQSKGARLTMMILDACRDNPFPKSGTRSLGGDVGLARMDPAEGAFILFSAGTGQLALDRLSDADPNPNSVFTRTLLPLMREKGLPVHELVRKVRRDVRALAAEVSHTQFPAYYDQLAGVFSFNPGAPETPAPVAPKPAAPTPQPPVVRVDPCIAARHDWRIFSTTTSISALNTFTLIHKDCPIVVAVARDRISALTDLAHAPALTPAPAPAPAPVIQQTAPQIARAGDTCGRLWYERNLIFHQKGFCFSTARAKAVFDTRQCFTRDPDLTVAERARVNAIKDAEKANGC